MKLRPKKRDYTTKRIINQANKNNKLTKKPKSFYDIKYKEQLNLATSENKRSVEKIKRHHDDHNNLPAQSIRKIVIKNNAYLSPNAQKNY